MPSVVSADVSTQPHMSLDDIISKAGARSGAQAARPAPAKAQLDKPNSRDRRGRGMFNVPRGIVKQRSSNFPASTYGLNLVFCVCCTAACIHVPSRRLVYKNIWVLMWRVLHPSASPVDTHPISGTMGFIAVLRRRPKDYDTQQFIKVNSVYQACTSAASIFLSRFAEVSLLQVSLGSDPKTVAGKIAHCARADCPPTVLAIGQGCLNQAIKV